MLHSALRIDAKEKRETGPTVGIHPLHVTVLIRALITQENGMPGEKRGRDRGGSEQLECEEGGYGARF